MNIYERRLAKANRMLQFLKKRYSPVQLKYWQDIQCNRDGIPQRLWKLREKLGLSMREFATSIGLKVKDYERFEKIGAKVPAKVIKLVVKKYNISENHLSPGTDKSREKPFVDGV